MKSLSTTIGQTMTTPEIAVLTGVRHDNVMRVAQRFVRSWNKELRATNEIIEQFPTHPIHFY